MLVLNAKCHYFPTLAKYKRKPCKKHFDKFRKSICPMHQNFRITIPFSLANKKCLVGDSVIGLDEVMIQTLPATDLRFHSRRSCVSNSCPAAGTDREKGEKFPAKAWKKTNHPANFWVPWKTFFWLDKVRDSKFTVFGCGAFFFFFFARALVGSSQKHAFVFGACVSGKSAWAVNLEAGGLRLSNVTSTCND